MRNTKTKNKSRRYVAAFFTDEDDLKASAAEARLRGFKIYDVYSPFPIHGMDDAVGLKPSRLTWVAFAGGVLGLATAVFLQVWTSAYDWAVNIGGKPFNSIPLWVPVSFELTVLFAGLSAIFALFWVCGLSPFSKQKSFKGVNDDRFVLVLDDSDASLSKEKAGRLFEKYGAVEVKEGVFE